MYINGKKMINEILPILIPSSNFRQNPQLGITVTYNTTMKDLLVKRRKGT